MIYKEAGLTYTVQSHSWTVLNEAERDQTTDKPATEDNVSLLFSICEGLNNLYEKLSKLDYMLKKEKSELMKIYKTYEGNT